VALRKDVFISATTQDLGSYRQVVKDALLKLGAHPTEQTTFPTDHRTVSDMLARLLDPCDAVIHLAGFHYGSEPPTKPGLARHSYAQLEYHRATKGEQPKPTYVFLARENCKFDTPPDADPEKQQLQREHRARLLADARLHYHFSTPEELRAIILEIDELRALLQPRLFHIPFFPLQTFVGRAALLAELDRGLQVDGSNALGRLAVLHADGGVGKTALAVELGRRLFEAGRFDFVLFLNASAPETLSDDLAALCDASALDLPEREAPEPSVRHEAVLRWLHTPGQARRALFLLDNADSSRARDAVRDLLPKLVGSAVLITSREDAWKNLRAYHLEHFTPAEASDFLRAHLDPALVPSKSEALFTGIAEALDHLPVALALGVSYLQGTRQSPAEWLEEWNGNPAQTLEHYSPDDVAYRQDGVGIPIPLARVWDQSVARLSRTARATLWLLALFAPHPASLPLEPYKKLEIWAPMRAVLSELARASLIRWPPGSDSVSIHSILQTVTRLRMKPDEKNAAVQVAIMWLEIICPDPGWSGLGWRLWERLAPHITALLHHVREEPVEAAATSITNKFAHWLRNRAEYSRAEEHLRRLLAIAERDIGFDHPSVGTLLNNLGDLLRVTNRFPEAEVFFRRALAINEKFRDSDDPGTANILNNLGLLLVATNRLADAEPLFQRAIAINEKRFGTEDPLVASNLNNLALVLQITDRLPEAEQAFRRSLVINEKNLGPDHPDLATGLNNLARLMQGENRLAEAEALYRRALAIDEKSVGANHPDVATDLNNLASLLQATDRFSEAEFLYRRALAINEERLGSHHTSVATGLNNLAALLHEMGRLAEAEALYKEGLAIGEKTLGPNHPDLATHLHNLGGLLRAAGRPIEAEEPFRRALAIDENNLGSEHPKIAHRLNNLAVLLEEMHRVSEAEPLSRRHLEILIKSLISTGNENPHLHGAFENYGSLLMKMGVPEKEVPRRLAEMVQRLRSR
jgi:tetratricopeptide (TPR) repeat protein